ncbi:histone-lysine N-methyltransferase PRDM9-like [Lytechinus variegatus]|uniref:histone-lysine N-methyltransferase PRDM9-like n=1 Tax=Lytechinus variegatus TaxID=7654 RepID=UPI001BB172B8|nr:histone-lysine N-methyltransferase PRDM9-like [Lytechinus variegatus]
MEYSYAHDRQEARANPEPGQGHPQNQHLLHYQHQQYPPPHHPIQTGYPGLRLAPYMNPLPVQGGGTPAGLGLGQEGGLVQPPRIPTSGSTASSRDSSQSSHEFENVLSTVMQGSNVQGHYHQEVPSHSQHGIPLQQIPTLPSTQQPSPPLQQGQTGSSNTYHIEDLSHNTRLPTTTSCDPLSTAPGSIEVCANTSKSNSRAVSSTGRTPKKRAAPGSNPKQLSKLPSMQTPLTQIVTPQVYQQTQVSQLHADQTPRPRDTISFSKHCQTEPLFQQVYNASVHFSKEKELPDGLRYTEDEKEKKISGVVATKDLEVGMQFGPFTGEFVKEGLGCFNPNTWEVCVRGKTWYYIDGATDPHNWMLHVQFARNSEEQNLEAFQFYGDIYFRTTKHVKSGTELRVFYSQDYSKHVGFKENLNNLLYFEDAERFECRDCDNRYTNSKSLFRHIKFEHDNKKNLIPPKDFEPAKPTPPPKPKIPNLMTIKDVAAKMARDKERNAEKARERPRVDKSKRFLKVKLVPLGKSSEKDEKEGEFSCKRCRKKFPSEGHLKEHAAFHKEMKDVKPICEVCGLECKHNKALKQHQLSHNPDAFQCEFCKRYFRRRGCLVYHLRHIHQTFVGEKWTRGNVQEQMTRYVGPGEEDEEEEFHPELPKDMLGKHILIKSKKPRVFKCQFCPKKFIRHNLVCKHERTVHMNNGRFKCEFCSKTFMEEYNYTLHKRKHTKERPFKCSECPQSFASEKALINHQPEHRGERPFKCDDCGKAFRTRKYMLKHKRRQHMAPSRLFKCGYCDKTFKDNTGRERHERRHKGIRPHVCLTCGKAFGTKYSLQTHLHVHTGEKKFSCHICGQKFALNNTLIRHLLRHDKESALSDQSISSVQDKVALQNSSTGNTGLQEVQLHPS